MSEGDSLDINKMMEMAKLFSSFMSQPKTEPAPKEPVKENTEPESLDPIQYLPTVRKNSYSIDSLVHTQEMKMIKAAIPFLDLNIQKSLALIIKILELRNTMQLYNDSNEILTQETKHPDRQRRMLQSIRDECTEPNQNIVDLMLKVMDMQSIMDRINQYNQLRSKTQDNEDSNDANPDPVHNEAEDEPSHGDSKQFNLDNLTGLLNPKQQEMFQNLAKMMKQNNMNGKVDDE